MMDRHITSEEKLLNLIRKKKHEPSGSQQKSQKDSSGQDEKTAKSTQFGFKILKTANLFLVFLMMGLSVYVGYRFVKTRENGTATQPKIVTAAGKPAGQTSIEFPKTQPLSYYLERVQQRDIFLSPWEKEVEEVDAQVKTLPDLSKTLSVVGIVLDDQPQAIIEDVASKQTYFLKVGEVIADSRIKKIEEDRVIFEYQGQEIILNR